VHLIALASLVLWVLSEGYRKGFPCPALVLLLEPFKSSILRVHQRIHGVDHERGYPFSGVRLPDHAVRNRQDVAKALPRSGAVSDDESLPAEHLTDSLFLVTIKRKRLAVRPLEDRRAFPSDPSLLFKLIGRGSSRIRRTHLDQEVRPKTCLLFRCFIHEPPVLLVGDHKKGTDEVAKSASTLR
jgi:hypothetical protein